MKKKQRLTALCLACLQSGKPDQGKNLQAITVSTNKLQYIEFSRLCRPDKAFTPHPA
ncbi:hypothetical protein OHD50_13470 [Escherichia coli]|nr:hypothetical protein [Escherichia coli]